MDEPELQRLHSEMIENDNAVLPISTQGRATSQSDRDRPGGSQTRQEDPFETLSSPDDVVNIYRLILGRSPESPDVVKFKTNNPLSEIIRETIASGEFSRIIHAFEARSSETDGPNLPHVRLDDTIYASVKLWVSRRLGVSVSDISDRKPDWPALLALFLSTWPTWDYFRNAFGQNATAFVDLLVKQRSRKKDAWLGTIDVASTDKVAGWLLNKNAAEVATVNFFANGCFIGMIECSKYRRDIQEVHGGTGICGFELRPILPARLQAESRLTITATDRETGHELPLHAEMRNASVAAISELLSLQAELGAISKKTAEIGTKLSQMNWLKAFPLDKYARFSELYGTPSPQLDMSGGTLPKISVIVPVYKPARKLLNAAIRSVQDQVYPHWELVLVNDAPDDESTATYLRQIADADHRIVLVDQGVNLGLGGAINEGLAISTGDYVCILDHDDELDKHALQWLAFVVVHTGAKLIYSDEDRFEYVGTKKAFHTPFFKPAFDYDLLLQRNYICHLTCISAETLKGVGGMRTEFEGAQDHDLVIRLYDALSPDQIVHIPLVLYHWHVTRSSYSSSQKNIEAIEESSRRAVCEHLARTGSVAEVVPYRDAYAASIRFCHSVIWPGAAENGRLAIIIPTRDRIEYLAPCIESIERNLSDPSRCEIIIVDNRSESMLTRQYLDFLRKRERIRVIDFDEEFNWSRANNLAVAATDADHLLFMNNDMVVLSQGIDRTVSGMLRRPDVGAVGGRLLYENGTIQHAGVALGVGGIAGHIGVGMVAGDDSYFDLNNVDHRVSAVTGALLGVSRSLFDRVNGFDEENLGIAFNDVDFCLKVHALGKSIIYTPKITCYHYESVSRGYDAIDPVKAARAQAEADYVRQKWGDTLGYDLYYNGTFDRYAPPYSMISMPTVEFVSEYISMQISFGKSKAKDA